MHPDQSPTLIFSSITKYLSLRPKKESNSPARESESKIQNPCRHGELVGPGVHRALVSKENAGGRKAGLVRAALRDGRSEFKFLFGAGSAPARALDLQHTG